MYDWFTDQFDFHRHSTGPHGSRVQRLADSIAAQLGISEYDREGLRIAADLHDIGKLVIPTEILRKPGPLTAEEREAVNKHPQAGYELLRHSRFPWPVAAMVHQNHERLDGSGYPLGLKGEEIPLLSRILAVADVADAMACHRPYHRPRHPDVIISELRENTGRLYDPDAAQACIRAIENQQS